MLLFPVMMKAGDVVPASLTTSAGLLVPISMERSAQGEVVAMPTVPLVVAKYAELVDERTVVDA